MTKRDDIDTVIRANKELLIVLAKVETSLAKVKEGFSSISLAQSEAAKTSNELGAQIADTGEIATANTEKSQTAAEKESENLKTRITLFETLGEAFSFLSQTEDNYKKAEKELIEGETGSLKTWRKAHEQEFTAIMGIHELYAASVKSLGAVHSSVYSAMEGQLMSFIETGRFSVGAFMQLVAKQVKVELVGLAARAAVWAIYETAMGFKDLAIGLPTAALHFKSAAQFAAVSGAALAAAAGVQSLSGGTQERKSSGTNAMALKTTGALPAGFDSGSQIKSTQQVTINIYNPLSEQNWAQIAEDNIIPAINDAANRNINIVVQAT